jgi:predicted DNA-binding protein (MmcQ/YjbR family)
MPFCHVKIASDFSAPAVRTCLRATPIAIRKRGPEQSAIGEKNMPRQSPFVRGESALRKHALAFPQTDEHFPWGHSAFKVKGKVFLFLYRSEEEGFLSLSVKLPVSGKMALTLPFTSPTEYGLAKSAWVTARFEADTEIPIDMLREWIDESFRAIAPRRVLAELEGGPAKPKKTPARRKKQ